MKKEYISIEEFARLVKRKVPTIKKRYKDIPGIVIKEKKYMVLKGTRYPCAIRKYNLKTACEKRYALLKIISKFEYVDSIMLGVYQNEFETFLKEFLKLGLICENKSCNCYGANAYITTIEGDSILEEKKVKCVKHIGELIGSIVGEISIKVFSQVFMQQ